MTCREVTEFLMAYLDGELDPAVRAGFERHMGVCPSCVAFLESYKRTVTLGQEACGCDHADAGVQAIPQGLIDAILAARRKGPSPNQP